MAHLFSSSPFHFGQRSAYYNVEITIHELKDVPLVSGKFQAKWRVRYPHSTRATSASSKPGVHGDNQQGSSSTQSSPTQPQHSSSLASRAVHNLKELVPGHNDFSDSDTDPSGDEANTPSQDQDRRQEHHGGDNDNSHLAIRRHLLHQDHQEGSQPNSTQHHDDDNDEDDSSSIASSSLQPDDHPTLGNHPRNFLSNIFHRRNRKDSQLSNDSHSHNDHHQDTVRQRKDPHRSQPSSPAIFQPSPSTGQQSPRAPVHHLSHAEPRGSTDWIRVQEHTVKWERTLHTGIRVPIEKPSASSAQPRSTSSSQNTPAHGQHLEPSPVNTSHNLSAESTSETRSLRKAKSSQRDLRLDDAPVRNSQDDSHNGLSLPSPQIRMTWGSLGVSEVKITVKQDIVTESGATDNPHNLGHVTVNLAEFAPCPATPHHHHHHHHHHGHHHHHHQPHHQHNHAQTQQHDQQSQSGQQSPPTLLSRTETRRYLLEDSKTNATLRLTVTMTHIDGAREYTVPVIKRGLPVGGMPQANDAQGKQQQLSRSQDQSRLRDGSAAHGQSQTSLHSRKSKRKDNPTSRYFSTDNNASRQTSRIPSSSFKNGGVGLKKLPPGWSRAEQPVGSVNALSTRKPITATLQRNHSSTDSVMIKKKGFSSKTDADDNKGSKDKAKKRSAGSNGHVATSAKGAYRSDLSFNFSGAENWEQDPDDVIQALFKNVADELKHERQAGTWKRPGKSRTNSQSSSRRPKSMVSMSASRSQQRPSTAESTSKLSRPGASPLGSNDRTPSIHSTRSMGAFERMLQRSHSQLGRHGAQNSDQTTRGANETAVASTSNASTPCASPKLTPAASLMPLDASSRSTSASVPASPGPAQAASSTGPSTPDKGSNAQQGVARVKWSPGVSSQASENTKLQPAFDDQRPSSSSSNAAATPSTYGLTPSRVPSSSSSSGPPWQSSVTSSPALSPSASTVMAEEPTPRPMRNVSMPMFADREEEELDEDEETDNHVAQHQQQRRGLNLGVDQNKDKESAAWLRPDVLSGTLRKRKSKGMIGIDPTQARHLGYKGVGWQSKKDEEAGEGPRAAEAQRAANGRVEIRSVTPPPEDQTSTGADTSSLSAQVQIPPSVLVDSSFVSDEGGEGSGSDTSIVTGCAADKGPRDTATDKDKDKEDKVSYRQSLNPYVKARLGRPRSRIGLNKKDEESVPVTGPERSVTGGPGPSVRQGELPHSVPLQESGAPSHVPALIPGSASIITSEARQSTPASGISSSAVKPPLPRQTSKANLVWADAQTELEARFVTKHGRPISGASLQPPSLQPNRTGGGRERTDSSASGRSSASGTSTPSSATAAKMLIQEQMYKRPGGVPAPGIHVARELESRQ